MRLHEFMLPEVVPESPRLDGLVNRPRPSTLFVGVDPNKSQVLLDEGLFNAGDKEKVAELTSSGYKHWRRQYAFTKPFSSAKKRFFVDFEDALKIPKECYFGTDFNVFQYNRRRGDRTSVLWRLPNYFEPSRGIGHPPRETNKDQIDFVDKIPKVYWRGGVSGSHWSNPFEKRTTPWISAENFNDSRLLSTFSRLKLVKSFVQSESVDAKFAGGTVERFVAPELLSSEIATQAVHTSEMMKYRYLLCPAGNDVSSALYWVIRTNSVAFKEETEYETIPDYFLKPWVHYIPISPGLADLEEKFNFCESRPAMCQEIVNNAKDAYSKITNTSLWEVSESIVLDRLGLL